MVTMSPRPSTKRSEMLKSEDAACAEISKSVKSSSGVLTGASCMLLREQQVDVDGMNDGDDGDVAEGAREGRRLVEQRGRVERRGHDERVADELQRREVLLDGWSDGRC